jgi:hypothetical protein
MQIEFKLDWIFLENFLREEDMEEANWFFQILISLFRSERGGTRRSTAAVHGWGDGSWVWVLDFLK